MAHAYVTFRFRLARHGLRAFAASFQGSAQILLLVGGNVVLALFALSAFPSMYAASLPPAQALPLLCAHALLMTLPLALLRKRVLPLDVVHWLHRLPVAPRLRLRADAMVALLLTGPLALLYLVSTVLLLWEGPRWLDRPRGVAGTVLSLLLTYALSIGVLAWRARRGAGPAFRHQVKAGPPAPYAARALRPRLVQLWLRLFWLPFWRAENVVGWQQSALLAAALAAAAAWMQAPAGVARGALALATCALMVLLTDRGDKAVREQALRLAPVMAPWPLKGALLLALARAFAALPALLVVLAALAGGMRHGVWSGTAGRVWLALACAAPLLLVATPLREQRARVGLVLMQILILTAVGSELWK